MTKISNQYSLTNVLTADVVNGRVGIGTASPLQKLHVNNSASTTAAIFQGSSNSYIQLGVSNESYIGNVSGALILETGGNEKMRITSAGNVGIGTSSPVYKLSSLPTPGASAFDGINVTTGSADVVGLYRTGSSYSYGMVGANQSWIYSSFGDLNILTDGSSTNIKFGTSGGAERMRITSGGYVGIGTSSPAAPLDIVNSNAASAIFNSTNANGGYLVFRRNGTDYGYLGNAYHLSIGGLNSDIAIAGLTNIIFASGGSLNIRGQVTSGGNWLLGTTTDNGERLYVSGSIRATGSITANSDVRLKKNIERIENALQKVSEISGYTYNTIYDEDRHAGVIAQEIDKVLPEIVNKGNDGLMGVEYGNISALLIEAIKEQKVLIESLQAKVEALSK